MAVIALTILISLLLVATFVAMFLYERSHRGFGSAEQDALLPLDDEKPAEPPKAPLP